mmetsp:Transcript_106828/g.189851  ORF Transcript_106828/g.189851 Transcript_106828/m.189851 type:complete len:306 (+) Transcript_106828:88-1005(+)|eukprot:CAMPEP_0197654482 /NCGR_PEP_ID=MMETSP1338-20131121/38874_1 /TAXON_ID=43686 ORGANISM="Pelagodinium beii, Strain RCC1491" /NCGR_SAMPLE_ID=MMETSP1338 /ASSEMBLY_ACC=CAM_ASM_000754 /LENGTH=305 /DNA_ID=CAMNT_0043229931 /DNA_START=88 /DNA_END=1005 /DNA_ORIENTATION=+
MASLKNDKMLKRNIEGSFNYYDGQKCLGTAADKGLAARLGGHNYNIVSNQDRHEVYFKDLRHDEHYLDKKGRHTAHFFGSRRRKFEIDERKHVADCMTLQADHPRDRIVEQRRVEKQLAQIENSQSWRGYQERTDSMHGPPPRRRYTINNARYGNEAEKLNVKLTGKADWTNRRGESAPFSASAPSLHLAAPAESLDQMMRSDARKEASQRRAESAHFAPWMSANTYGASLDGTAMGREHAAAQRHLSMARLENHDFAVARKNNHFSSQDKLTRADPYFMRPRLGITNNSVKYDIVNNERTWFKY